MNRVAPIRFAVLSMVAALATMALKAAAYYLTGSVGLLSDALESLVNLAGALMAIGMLVVASRPADEDHPYGHTKAEYFSSGVEGGLILTAAIGIALAAVPRLLHPKPLEQVGLGLAVAAAASAINLAAAIVLLRVARKHASITLEANARHLLTDVWTSVGVVVGVGAVKATGWLWLDPVVALLVAVNIVYTGVTIIRRSILGLMDTGLPPEDRQRLLAALVPHRQGGIEVHALRTRQSGARRFISFHVLVPGEWTVHRGHELLEAIEADVRRVFPGTTVFTHLESIDDPRAWDDTELDRKSELALEGRERR